MYKNISDYNKGKQNPSYTAMLGNGYFTIKSANPIFTPFFKEKSPLPVSCFVVSP